MGCRSKGLSELWAVQDFKLGGDAFKKDFGVFRVKNHDFTPKILFFSNFRGARAGCVPLDPPLIHIL